MKNNNFLQYNTKVIVALLAIVAIAAGFTACSGDDEITDPPSKHIIGIWYDEQNQPGSIDVDGVKISYQKVVQYVSFEENGEGFWSIIFVDDAGHAIDIPGYFCGGSIVYVDKSNDRINVKSKSAGIPILKDSWDVLYTGGKLHVKTSEINHAMTPITDEQNTRVQKWLRELGLGGVNMVDISNLKSDYIAQDGDVLTGKLNGNYKISIANDAFVTFDGVTINSSGAAIRCEGNATIFLADDSTNELTSTSTDYSALMVGDYETTLTIQGNTGKLTVVSGAYCAGIGGGIEGFSGNVVIEGGVINVTGGDEAAGIGSDYYGCCGDITISGGTITVTGGHSAPAIGSGRDAECGRITITKVITKLTVNKGGGAPDVIGIGEGNSHCGDITFGEGRNSNVGYNGYWKIKIMDDCVYGGLLLTVTEYKYGDIIYSYTLVPEP